MSYDPVECPQCMEFYYRNPLLVEAAASVGIEHGMSTSRVLTMRLYLYHRKGHGIEGSKRKGATNE